MANHLDLEEQEQLDQLKHFWSTWGTLISSATLLIACSAAAWSGYQYWQGQQAVRASALLDAVNVATLSREQLRLEQTFGDLKSKYANTVQSGQAALVSAKFLVDAEKSKLAKDALTWVAQNAEDDVFKALAKLRLSSILMNEKNFDEALEEISNNFPDEFLPLVADRKGDIYLLQKKREEAIIEYEKSFKGFDSNMEYKRLVEIKLISLGVIKNSVVQDINSSSTEKK